MSHVPAPPPPQRLPKKILDDPELKDFFNAIIRSNFIVWSRVGRGLVVDGDVGLFGADAVDQAAAMTAQLTTITHTAPGTPDYALQDLIDSGVGSAWGFASQDEGNTLLSVIANLQARVAELEAGLDSSTGIGVFT